MNKQRKTRGNPQLSRTVGSRAPKKRVVVVCEGEKTEPTYLRLIDGRSKTALVELQIVDEPATAPKILISTACELMRASKREASRTRDPNAQIDEVWCVFDVDEHPGIPEAKQQARDNGIRVAVSNPSIEVWFLWHFVDQTAFIHRSAALHELKRYIKDYDKKFSSVEALEGRYEAARTRAQLLDKKHSGDRTVFPHDNPRSNVWELVESLQANY